MIRNRFRSVDQRRNFILNSAATGVSAGTPGTAPNRWSVTTTTSGITRQILSATTENGLECFNVRYSGTPSGGLSVSASFEAANGVAARAGEIWSISVFLKLVSGALPGSAILDLLETNGTSGTNLIAAQTVTVTGDLMRYSGSSVLTNGATTHIQPRVRVPYTVGVDFDFTISIAAPLLVLGARVTPPIRTSA